MYILIFFLSQLTEPFDLCLKQGEKNARILQIKKDETLYTLSVWWFFYWLFFYLAKIQNIGLIKSIKKDIY